MRARVVEAEAQVPLAMAEAFRSGNLSVVNDVRRRMIRTDKQQQGPETRGSSA